MEELKNYLILKTQYLDPEYCDIYLHSSFDTGSEADEALDKLFNAEDYYLDPWLHWVMAKNALTEDELKDIMERSKCS